MGSDAEHISHDSLSGLVNIVRFLYRTAVLRWLWLVVICFHRFWREIFVTLETERFVIENFVTIVVNINK